MHPIVQYIRRRRSLSLNDGSFIAFSFRTGALLAIFMILDRIYEKVLRLPETVYTKTSILFGQPDNGNIAIVIGILLIGTILCWKCPGMRVSWQKLASGDKLRWFIGLMMAALLWSFAAYPTNYHFGQEH
ncbi:MAG: hypothetical protein L7V86_27810 [Verrucomicrobiales bacterium]|nr:hypothetical protein [Verrucomicrobiales bacterium]